jgi:hypothetical protein
MGSGLCGRAVLSRDLPALDVEGLVMIDILYAVLLLIFVVCCAVRILRPTFCRRCGARLNGLPADGNGWCWYCAQEKGDGA